MRKLIAICATSAALSGCAAGLTGKLDSASLAQVAASIGQADGEIKFSSNGTWLPNAKEFKFDGSQSSILGVVSVTEKAIVFQQWGGSNGLTTLKRIPSNTISEVYLVTFGMGSRVVVRSANGRYDSFSATPADGQATLWNETAELRDAINEAVK